MIEMFVTGVALDVRTDVPMVILNDNERKYSLPIWIGQAEAQAIARGLEGTEMERPMTHDLVTDILDSSEISVDSIEINSFEDTTFFASIILIDRDDKTLVIDSRPSDAIALALRLEAPIFVAESILADLNPDAEFEMVEEEEEEDMFFDSFFTPDSEINIKFFEEGDSILEDWEFKQFLNSVKASDFSLPT